MPRVLITLHEGRTRAQIATLVTGVTEAIASTLDVPHERVRITLNEIRPTRADTGRQESEQLGTSGAALDASEARGNEGGQKK